MRITIIGGGAIGAICGAYLTRAGKEVTVVEPYEEHRRLIRQGARIDGVRGEMMVPLRAIAPSKLEGFLELVLLTVKSGKTIEALEPVKALAGADTVIVTLQNSINEDKIAAMFGPERTVGCITGWGAIYVAPGHLRQASEGKFTIGEMDGRITPRLELIKSVLDDVSETVFTDNLYGHRWSKLCVNCLIAGCAVLGQTVGEALAPERNKEVFVKLVREVVSVAEACGVRLEKFDGLVDPSVFKRTDADGRELCHSILDMMAALHGLIKPGFLQDIEKGIESEVAYINGYCVARAKERGVPAPINARVTDSLKAMEAGKLAPSPENIRLLEEAAAG